ARIAADQDHRARHDAAAEHAVELADAARAAPLACGGKRRDRLRPPALATGTAARPRLRRDRLLDQRVPLAAVRAAPEPARRLRTAVLTREHRAPLGHGAGC